MRAHCIFLMKKIFAYITLSLPVALFILVWRMQTLGNGELSRSECPVKQKNIPIAAIPQPKKTPAEKQKTTKRVPLLPTKGLQTVACCPPSTCLDVQIWERNGQPGDKKALLNAIARSLQYLQTGDAATVYKRYQVAGITRDRVLRSLKRFRELVLKSNSAAELQAALNREFIFYQSVGHDAKGSVLFTAYYEPIYAASRVRTAEYRYPIYRLPPDLESWPQPHPTREQLEGKDGLQFSKTRLRGLELFWLRSRMDAFIAQIEGSARLELTDGSQTTVGYAGNTKYSYTSIGRELAEDGKLPLEGMTMPIILQYFNKHPLELNIYLPRNHSFVFFQDNKGKPAMGSINVPVTAERSIATDKSLMPPGALAFIRTSIPFVNNSGKIEHRIVSRYVLDQDTGGAIKGAGRVDYFLGTGKQAGDRAGVTVSTGNLYYLLLK